ncbi:MAG: Hint domain-containing protein [Paracoccaceae bacterium]
MSYIVRSNVNPIKPQPWTVTRQTPSAVKPKELDVVTRRYEIEWLSSEGTVESKTCVAPAMQIFEKAFSAFAQGTLIQTQNGEVAIEDLRPGSMIATADGGLQPLLWSGSMTLFPQNLELGVPTARLFRVTEGSYGQNINGPDLLLGPAARILPGHLAIDSTSPLMALDRLADGGSIIGINPVSPVRVFHLGLESHRLMRANGVLVESYHPGEQPHMHMTTELYPHFVALFPHLESISGFGPLNHKR